MNREAEISKTTEGRMWRIHLWRSESGTTFVAFDKPQQAGGVLTVIGDLDTALEAIYKHVQDGYATMRPFLGGDVGFTARYLREDKASTVYALLAQYEVSR